METDEIFQHVQNDFAKKIPAHKKKSQKTTGDEKDKKKDKQDGETVGNTSGYHKFLPISGP